MVLKGHSLSSNINLPSEVAALREEKEEAEKKVLAVMKNMQQKDERITLLQVRLGLRFIPTIYGQRFRSGATGNCARESVCT